MGFLDLFKPKWKHSNPEVRKAAIEGVTGEAVLADIANNDQDHLVREEAAKRITSHVMKGDNVMAKCPYCKKELGAKPEFSGGVSVGGDAFLNCDNGHERVAYSALTKDWSTYSEKIAQELKNQGYVVKKEGNVYIFED